LTYNQRYKELPRIIHDYSDLRETPTNPKFTVCTSGFPFRHKQLHKIIQAVNQEFSEDVLIKMHLPIHPNPHITKECKKIITELQSQPRNQNVELQINSTFLSTQDLAKFVASSDLACYFYKVNQPNSGSSSIDLALSARVPIAVTPFKAFNPFIAMAPEIVYNGKTNTLHDIYQRGTSILKPMYEKWKPEAFVRRIEDLILDETCKPNL
jgi:hypothetical protein